MAGKKNSPRDNDSDLKNKLEKTESKSYKKKQITRSKRLKELQDKLEGSHNIERVKDLKKKTLALQFLGIVILFPFLMYFNGASFDPLYLPIYHSLLMLFGWILIIFISSFIFRILRIKRHKSYSTKFLLARNSIRKSISLAVVALIIFGVIYTPYFTEMVNDLSSMEGKTIQLEEKDNGNFEAEIEFTSRDVLDMRELKSVTIGYVGNLVSEINITLYEKDDEVWEKITFRTIDEQNRNETFGEGDFDTSTFKELIFHLSSEEDSTVEYSCRREVFPTRQTSFSILSFLYMGIFIQSAAILYPFKKRYTGEGIYR